MEKDNLLHICAKRLVSKDLFDNILKNVQNSSKIDEMLKAPDSKGNLPLHIIARTQKINEADKTNETNRAKKMNEDGDLDENDEIDKAISYICEGLINASKGRTSGEESLLLHILSQKNLAGNTAAHEASLRGHYQILKLMWEIIPEEKRMKRNNGLFAVDHNRFTCLHLAAMNADNESKKCHFEQAIFCIKATPQKLISAQVRSNELKFGAYLKVEVGETSKIYSSIP